MTSKERTEKQKQLQTAMAEALAAIERAKELSNALEVPFTILGRTYSPLKVVTQGGHFDHEKQVAPVWESSNELDTWSASGPGIGC